MNRTLGFLLLATAATLLPGCSLFHEKPKKEEKPKEPATKLVGRVASISGDKKFVLIQSYGNWEVPTGAILATRAGENRVSNLRCSGEKLGQFAAADIQGGMPEVGDGVLYTPPVEETTPVKPVPEPADDKKKPVENIPPAPSTTFFRPCGTTQTA
ncbi:hypothetical protein KBB96_08295 [Luteolibacter ambystomatis]|uniref:Uncharacterized protein n=1 Tax=Luteolibacter ambystomatis TaxID=2824561 RepID=A0A975J2N8_9BACT|nr:hypothetical protein [Luteolibacter ambystomatis]QUE52879.1 hypothetical protein KBB96_08295 [Luteolibacter ambystomatis]